MTMSIHPARLRELYLGLAREGLTVVEIADRYAVHGATIASVRAALQAVSRTRAQGKRRFVMSRKRSTDVVRAASKACSTCGKTGHNRVTCPGLK